MDWIYQFDSSLSFWFFFITFIISFFIFIISSFIFCISSFTFCISSLISYFMVDDSYMSFWWVFSKPASILILSLSKCFLICLMKPCHCPFASVNYTSYILIKRWLGNHFLLVKQNEGSSLSHSKIMSNLAY